MTNLGPYKPYLWRLGLVAVISIVSVAVFNEIVHAMLKDPSDRSSTIIQLVIPPGTAEKVASGQDEPILPKDMVFVAGDTLVVNNQDTASHQLGPLWVPAGASASLVLDRAENLVYSCSFQSTRYMGVDVRQPTTMVTRLTALAVAAPTVAALLFFYSLVLFPVGESPRRQSAPANR
jgi:hypothetical protein